MTECNPNDPILPDEGGEKKNLLRGRTKIWAVVGSILCAAIGATTTNAFAQKDAGVPDNVELIPLSDAINQVDLTGHGANDVVLRARRYLKGGHLKWAMEDVFLVDVVSDDPGAQGENSAKNTEIVEIEERKSGPTVDHIDEIYEEQCQEQGVILYKRKDITYDGNGGATNTFLIVVSYLDKRDGNHANVTKYRMFDWGGAKGVLGPRGLRLIRSKMGGFVMTAVQGAVTRISRMRL